MQQALKARVRNGRLVLDEPTNLPEGAEVHLVSADADDLDDEERAQLHLAIEDGLTDMKEGRTTDAAEVLARLRASVKLRLARRAERDAARIDARWRAERPAAPGLFLEELATLLDLLVVAPELGKAYGTWSDSALMRRVMLEKSEYHVYYAWRATSSSSSRSGALEGDAPHASAAGT